MIGFHDDANTWPCESCNGDGRFELWWRNDAKPHDIEKWGFCKDCALKLAEQITSALQQFARDNG